MTYFSSTCKLMQLLSGFTRSTTSYFPPRQVLPTVAPTHDGCTLTPQPYETKFATRVPGAVTGNAPVFSERLMKQLGAIHYRRLFVTLNQICTVF